jgi:hypothetical protein
MTAADHDPHTEQLTPTPDILDRDEDLYEDDRDAWSSWGRSQQRQHERQLDYDVADLDL